MKIQDGARTDTDFLFCESLTSSEDVHHPHPGPWSPGRYLDILKMLFFFEGLLSLPAILSPTNANLTK